MTAAVDLVTAGVGATAAGTAERDLGHRGRLDRIGRPVRHLDRRRRGPRRCDRPTVRAQSNSDEDSAQFVLRRPTRPSSVSTLGGWRRSAGLLRQRPQVARPPAPEPTAPPRRRRRRPRTCRRTRSAMARPRPLAHIDATSDACGRHGQSRTARHRCVRQRRRHGQQQRRRHGRKCKRHRHCGRRGRDRRQYVELDRDRKSVGIGLHSRRDEHHARRRRRRQWRAPAADRAAAAAAARRAQGSGTVSAAQVAQICATARQRRLLLQHALHRDA